MISEGIALDQRNLNSHLGRPLFSLYRPLSPKEQMRDGAICWCGSGRKWASCHRFRHLKKRLPDAALEAEFYTQAKHEVCLHPEAPKNCSAGSIRAHTIQRATALRSIAEDAHVLSGRNPRPGDNNEDILTRVGVNEASTFRGFCSYHDNDTFKPSDLAKDITSEVAFLLSYRALCYEIYMKMVAVPTLMMYRDHLDAGTNFAAQERTQQILHAMIYTNSLGRDEHQRLKANWDEVLLSKNYQDFKWASYTFSTPFPIVTSGAFFPEYDFGAKPLQQLDAPIGALALLAFNVIPIENLTRAIFGWLDNKQQGADFLNSLDQLRITDLGAAIIQFCFETSDNIFVRPSWWASLARKQQIKLGISLRNSTPAERNPRGLIPVQNLFSADLIEKLINF